MRVLLATHEYPPETAWGGIGTYAGTIAPALASLGAEVHVVAAGHVRERSTTVRDGVHVHRAPLGLPAAAGRLARAPESWRRLSLATAVAREHRRIGLRFDVCEAPDWGAEGAVLSERRTLPLVVRLHSGAAQILSYVGPDFLDRRLATRMEQRVIRRADLVTATAWQLDYARKNLRIPSQRLAELTYPVRPVEAGPGGEAPEILFLGRMEERKGPATLVRALPGLIARVPDARLTIVGADTPTPGGGSYRATLERLAATLRVAPSVAFDTSWGPDTVRERLRRARVVAVPSKWESFGYVAAEAMSAGRPVVASTIPAFRDLVRDGVTGRLAPADVPAAWASALAELLEDVAGARAVGAAARAEIAVRYAPARVAAATLDAYERAIAAHARVRR